MKQQWILLPIAMLFSLTAHATGAASPPAEMTAAEVTHQVQLEQLQKQHDAAFLKQLETEALIEEQREYPYIDLALSSPGVVNFLIQREGES